MQTYSVTIITHNSGAVTFRGIYKITIETGYIFFYSDTERIGVNDAGHRVHWIVYALDNILSMNTHSWVEK